jgi:hypothetical protein
MEEITTSIQNISATSLPLGNRVNMHHTWLIFPENMGAIFIH